MDGIEHEAAAIAAPYTGTSRERRAAMVRSLQMLDARGIEGDIVECGVWRGGNIILARRLSPDRVVWLYDTFSGMTMPGPEDVAHHGASARERYHRQRDMAQPWCFASIETVKANLRATDTLDDAKLRFVAGDVLVTLKDAENLPERIALLRLDTDWYASTKVELEVLFPLLVQGGVLIVDDYGHWQGAKKAVDEYFAGKGVRLEKIDYTGVMMVKV